MNRIYIRGFERYLKLKGIKDNTVASYVSPMKMLSAKWDIMNWKKRDIEDNILLNPHLKPATKKIYVIGLRKFFDYLMENRIRSANPTHEVRCPKVINNRPRYLKKEEIQKIFNYPMHLRDKLIIHLLFFCGLRAFEVLKLTKRDIDLNNRIIIVQQGKGDKYREVPFPTSMLDLFKAFFEKYKTKDHLFYSLKRKRQPMKYQAIRKLLEYTGKKLGIHYSAHKFRHSYATFLFNSGLQSEHLMAFMGHSNFQTTKRYLYIQAETRRREYDKCDLENILR